ncbi:hypothetical protein BDQ12DRAFT_682538 [Crucibulum laeve]|uniref:Phosphatidic acid phosphatase type 2/haloperoxidase domain-containing protein n=1 Tax=Crucibulum laeve TaxID=68775 RepID=A0A5C3M4M0_9AGAR|nr:hypothetical protein BDQ12DRAFT_682538 [Crucibulum laeve]
MDDSAGQRPGRVRFSLSEPSSAASSRSNSPVPQDDAVRYTYGGDGLDEYDEKMTYEPSPLSWEKSTPGRLPMDVYEATLPWWRAAIRRRLVKMVALESEVIAKMQNKIRTPWLDAYFVYTSSLGTHTFFMILLPASFFFGYGEMGRGLIMVLGLGVYCSSVIKDLICSPRPFAPPVTRLTIGSHHLEYGFPSTHSTNSVSIALFFFGHVHRLASTPTAISSTSMPYLSNFTTILTNSTIVPIDTLTTIAHDTLEPAAAISTQTYTFLTALLGVYTFSIVFGRLYTAMHSFIDCITGMFLGAAIWWAHTNWAGIPIVLSAGNPIYYIAQLLGLGAPTGVSERIIYLGRGLGVGGWMESWVQRGGWEVPLILIPICLLLVNQHPQPVDDCPCFEDAIAFASVVLGALVGRWGMQYAGVGMGMGRTVVMPGSGWILDAALGEWVQVERTWGDVGVWWAVAALKMVVGVLIIFVWRILAKSTLHLILPPTFRLLARAFRLPHRRFYTPATEYKNVPSEFNSPSGFGLHPIPSVIDLPGSAGVGVEIGGIGSGSSVGGMSNVNGTEIKMRGSQGQTSLNTVQDHFDEKGFDHGFEREEREDKAGQPVKHYDADVLTKVIVYAGIAVLAAEALPVLFEVIGWGVKSWV